MKDTLSGINYRFNDTGLLQQALTHKSRGDVNYERLEFLGDSVLNVVVSLRLFETRPEAQEGDLSRMRARIVRGKTLADLASGIGVGKHLRLGEGELKSGGTHRASILADSLEALFGAIYLDGGYDACREVILDMCNPLIEQLPDIEQLKDAKTRLQEWMQGRGRPLPVYDLIEEEGADHAKKFRISCSLPDDGTVVEAIGASRRKAEQKAAALLLEVLSESETG